MKSILRIASVIAATVWAPHAFANCADLANVTWTDANIDALRTCDKAAIEQFANALNGDDPLRVVVGEYRWLSAGSSGYYLVTTADLSGRGFFDTLAIYTRSDAGKVGVQSLYGVRISLENAVRDLDGDGKVELIIPTPLADQDARAAVPVAVWPKIYRLRGGHYEDASSKFATYYEDEVLPGLDKKIDDAKMVAEDAQSPQRLAALEMTKDKILRATGRDPNAGFDKAREWTRSSDASMIGNAVVVLGDMGGHPDALRAAEDALRTARGSAH